MSEEANSAASAARFCVAENVSVILPGDDGLLLVRAHVGTLDTRAPAWPVDRTTVSGRAVDYQLLADALDWPGPMLAQSVALSLCPVFGRISDDLRRATGRSGSLPKPQTPRPGSRSSRSDLRAKWIHR